MLNQKQLELGLAGANRCPRAIQRERKFNRANWWFSQMRHVVDGAFEWEPTPRFQPEQILLADAREHNRG
ncbi:MAG TPA: hypothetical protein VK731_08925 [Candidatus Cybelea sp.]|jgi:hypothetical protein|nr:hypothetical protein [Candidatus Cybelea sp.]